jgi:hypothetical protein
MLDRTSEGDVSLDLRVDPPEGVVAPVDCALSGKALEMSESKDICSESTSVVTSESERAGERGVPGVRLASLVQKESLEARVLAIGELVSESSEFGVEVPESGELGELGISGELLLKVLWVCKGVINLIWSLSANVTRGVGITAPLFSSSSCPSASASDCD